MVQVIQRVQFFLVHPEAYINQIDQIIVGLFIKALIAQSRERSFFDTYVKKLDNALPKVAGFLWVLWFSPTREGWG